MHNNEQSIDSRDQKLTERQREREREQIVGSLESELITTTPFKSLAELSSRVISPVQTGLRRQFFAIVELKISNLVNSKSQDLCELLKFFKTDFVVKFCYSKVSKESGNRI